MSTGTMWYLVTVLLFAGIIALCFIFLLRSLREKDYGSVLICILLGAIGVYGFVKLIPMLIPKLLALITKH